MSGFQILLSLMVLSLCQLKCSGCQKGKFGTNCDQSCSSGCKQKECHWQNGQCLYGCTDGYSGSYCNKRCGSGLYGGGCIYMCPSNCAGDKCHHVTGMCESCKSGFYGDFCVQKQYMEFGLPLLVRFLALVTFALLICLLIHKRWRPT